jgi:hypothetical protein
METNSEDQIHKLRLRINDTVFDSFREPSTGNFSKNNNNSNQQFNMNFNNNSSDDFGSINQPFDALQSRRSLLRDISSNNIIRAQNLLASPTSRKSMQFFNGNLDSSRIGFDPVPLNYVNSSRQPTFAATEMVGSDNMEDLINVMAKRRIAIKRLENEMYANHSRAASNANILQSTASLRSIDAYDNYERQQSRRASRATNRPLDNQFISPTTREMRQQAILNSNLDYPSETNREIYSTYLVDSVRPHYSARRMINGKSGSIQFYNRPSIYENSGESVDPYLLKSRLLSKRPSHNGEKLDDYEFVL